MVLLCIPSQFGLLKFGLDDNLRENTIVDTWMEDNPKFFNTWMEDDLDEYNNVKTLNNRKSSGSAIQLSSQTCF